MKIMGRYFRPYALRVRLKIVSHNFGDIDFVLSTRRSRNEFFFREPRDHDSNGFGTENAQSYNWMDGIDIRIYYGFI